MLNLGEVHNDLREDRKSIETTIGTVQFTYDDQDGSSKLYLNGIEMLAEPDNTSLNIVVRRGDTVVDNVRFVYTVDAETTIVNVTATNRD